MRKSTDQHTKLVLQASYLVQWAGARREKALASGTMSTAEHHTKRHSKLGDYLFRLSRKSITKAN